MVPRSRAFVREERRTARRRGAALAACVVALVALRAAQADSGLEEPALQPMGAAMLSTDLQLDPSGELWIGYGRVGVWAASLQVPMRYDVDDSFFGFGVHGAYRLWPQILGGSVFLEPHVGISTGLTNGKREAGLGGGLSFGYTFSRSAHASFSARAGFDLAPVAPRGYFGVELLLH
ncbi:MAG: hypothetical protein R3B48_28040 [Kofleriaceae bacterium]